MPAPGPDTDVDLRGVVRDFNLNVQGAIPAHAADGEKYCIGPATDPRPPRGLTMDVVLPIAHAPFALQHNPHDRSHLHASPVLRLHHTSLPRRTASEQNVDRKST